MLNHYFDTLQEMGHNSRRGEDIPEREKKGNLRLTCKLINIVYSDRDNFSIITGSADRAKSHHTTKEKPTKTA